MINVLARNCSKDTSLPTSEWRAACRLKSILDNDLQSYPDSNGTIIILSNFSVPGQNAVNIDLLVVGMLDNTTLQFPNIKEDSSLGSSAGQNFVCNIELKSHDRNNIQYVGGHYMVNYTGSTKDASLQCQSASFSLSQYLYDLFSCHPYISNVLWFEHLTGADLSILRNNVIDNALPADFHLSDLIRAMNLSV